jgi:hypothetical protein
MQKSIKKFAHQMLLRRQRSIVPTTSPDAFREFLNMVRPVATNHPLVRLGCDGDGGYLVPDDLLGLGACFSPGVSTVADFELSLAERGIPCYLADYSVDQAPVQHPLISFEKKFLGLKDDEVFTTLDAWVNQHAADKTDFLLQMDIEGAEYDVLFDVSDDTLKKCRILVIEFHHLDRLIIAEGFRFLNLIFKKIDKYFKVVHIHPNNCAPSYIYDEFEIPPIMEFTFLRRDRITKYEQVIQLPHRLDQSNIQHLPDVKLPICWIKT